MTAWPEVQTRRLFRVVNGGTPTADPGNWDGDVPWATPVDLGEQNGRILEGTTRTLTARGLETGSGAVPAGSLLLSSRAPIGYVAETCRLLAFNQGCRGLVPLAALDTRFYRYVFASLGSRLQSRGQGSTFVELSSSALAEVPLPWPDQRTQRAIADFLDTETARIDALITKKRRIRSVLSERLIVCANQLTRSGPPIMARRVLDGVKTGTTPGPGDSDLIQRDGDIEWASPSDVADGLTLMPTARSVAASAVTRRIVPLFPAGSVAVVGIGATAGRVAHLERPVSGNQQMTCLVPNGLMDSRFLAWQLWARTDEIRGTAPYTTLPILNNEFLRSLCLFVPPLAEQREHSAMLDDERDVSDCVKRALEKQIALLREHRQALITAAVTGEFDIPEAAA